MCTWTESVREAFSSLLKQPAHGQHVPAPGCANAWLVTTLPERGFGLPRGVNVMLEKCTYT